MGGSKRSFHHLPEEIIQEILCHLPVKSLLRFKCVSKRWHSLISSKQFIKHHLKKSSADLSRHKLILLTTPNLIDNRSSHLINHGFKSCSLRSLIEDSNVTADHIHNGYILRLKYYNPATDPSNIYGGREDIGIYYPSGCFIVLDILGSCNGLILIRIDRRNLFIWNPTTRQAKSIARPACHAFRVDLWDTRRGASVYGFEYDISADEYKIVCIFFSHRKNPRGTTEIYSSRTDSWKKIEDFDMVSFRRTEGRFVRGKMHWLADPKDGACCVIVSLDLSEEKYGIVGRPEYFSNRKHYFYPQPRLHELGGYLSLTSFNENVVLGGIDVWVMTKYGETESWVKFWTISDEMMSVHGRETFSWPLMLTTIENGDIVFSFAESRGLNVVVCNGSNLLHKSRVDEVFAYDHDGAFFNLMPISTLKA